MVFVIGLCSVDIIIDVGHIGELETLGVAHAPS